MESKKKILLIEDMDVPYERVHRFFSNFEVDFFPSTELEFQNLARLVITFSRSKDKTNKDELLLKIHEVIERFNPDIILIDLGLDGKKESRERHGIEILNYINKKFDASILKFIISHFKNQGDIECDGYIERGNIPIETLLEEKITTRYEINKKETNSIEANPVLPPSAKHTIILHTKLEKYENYDYKFISPWISTILDKLVTYGFYILIVTLFILAPIDIYNNAIKHGTGEMQIDSFKIAERTFIAFLPFLITCSFYIFYTKSLRSYFFNSIVDPRIEDFESSSVLMKLTKKLFISSLLSYLFIKLIELLCFESLDAESKYFEKYYGKTNPFLQLYFTAGLIAILILYFIYIDRNHRDKKTLVDNK